MEIEIADILDANAMIAFLRDEPGADVVEQVLLDKNKRVFAHSLNLCEVYYDTIRFSNEDAAEKAIKTLNDLGVIERPDFDQGFWKEVGRLKAKHRASLGDFCGVVLTNRLSGNFLTADHHEFDKLAQDSVCSIQFIR
ncbi:MAG: PIN domain-containing protein [Acidobacteriota bacterium]|nr:PIN domain-containing protein [Acidobacteriota bacterium]